MHYAISSSFAAMPRRCRRHAEVTYAMPVSDFERAEA